MRVEIDQSGKIEQLNTNTVLAYSNGQSGAIFISAINKQLIFQFVRRTLLPEVHIQAILFGIAVFLLVEDLPNGFTLVIDEEYTGKEKIVEEVVLKLLQRKFKYKWRGNIRFKRIGKGSPAHKLAWKLHKSKGRGVVRKIGNLEMVKLLK